MFVCELFDLQGIVVFGDRLQRVGPNPLGRIFKALSFVDVFYSYKVKKPSVKESLE